MILQELKRIIFLIYFIVYTLYCTKALKLPMIKNKETLFYNEFLNISPVFYKNIFGSDIYQSGNFITSDKIDIITCNHINRIDSFIISSIIKNNTQKNIYPVIQKEIAKIPIIGSFAPVCIVLERDYDKDKNTIVNALKKINSGIILILPEGTRMNENNFKKSQEYSEKNNLKKYNNLIYPKMKGLDLIVNELNNEGKLGNLIDLTIKVKDKLKFRTEYLDFIKYKIGNVYCNVNTYKINDSCYNNYDNFKKWYLSIWDKKEDYINNYIDYEYKKLNYTMKTSTFILHVIFLSIGYFYLKSFTDFSLFKKNNIVI
jgi:lysocardiolipin and lysophospholipid acyltransferase